jgi:hypothetical protein
VPGKNHLRGLGVAIERAFEKHLMLRRGGVTKNDRNHQMLLKKRTNSADGSTGTFFTERFRCSIAALGWGRPQHFDR